MRFHTRSAAETRSLGRTLGELLGPGDFVALVGGLGSGKTVFVQGAFQGLGYDGPVASPSFTIVNEYSGRVPVAHVDLYRIEEPHALRGLGIREIFWNDGVTLVEWADRAAGLLPTERLDVTLALAGPESRDLAVSALGQRAGELLARLAAAWPPLLDTGRPKDGR